MENKNNTGNKTLGTQEEDENIPDGWRPQLEGLTNAQQPGKGGGKGWDSTHRFFRGDPLSETATKKVLQKMDLST